MMTAGQRSSARRRGEKSRGSISRKSFAISVITAIVLAVVVFLLFPTGQVSSRGVVQINGFPYLVTPGTRLTALARASALLARSGSAFDITGDVMAIAEGSPAAWDVDGVPVSGDPILRDGSVVAVRHGEHRLEMIKRSTQAIPFETTYEGSGAIVTLANPGSPGEREIYKGVSSGKQAATLVVTPAENAVVRRSNTAKPGQKLAALTFDDGPGEFTQAVLDALAAKHIPATFFMLGASAAANRDLVGKVKAAGHEVENHSWSHRTLTKLTPEQIHSEISRTNAAIGAAHFLRPPYGTFDAVVAAEVKALGMRIALWTVDTLDWKYPSVASILANVKAEIRPGAIILMHDGGNDRSQTVAAIPVVVDWLLAHGYSLTKVENLL